MPEPFKVVPGDEDSGPPPDNPLANEGRGETTVTGAKGRKKGFTGWINDWGPHEVTAKLGIVGLCISVIYWSNIRAGEEQAEANAYAQGQLFGLVSVAQKASEDRFKAAQDAAETRFKYEQDRHDKALSRQWENMSKISEAVRAIDLRTQLDSQRIVMTLDEIRGSRTEVKKLEKDLGSVKKAVEGMEP